MNYTNLVLEFLQLGTEYIIYLKFNFVEIYL